MKIALKIGGSVFEDEDSYIGQARNILEIMERYDPQQLFVIVSAMQHETDRHIRYVSKTDDEQRLRNALRGKDAFREYDNVDISSFLLQPEIESAYMLKDSFDSIIERDSLDAYVLEQGNPMFPVIGNHSYLSAIIDMQESDKRKDYLEGLGRLVIVSGFGAVNNHGHKVLLGRNATDVVAAMIGKLAGVDKQVYLKDVEGIFECFGTEDQRKLDCIDYHDALGMDLGQVLDKRVFDILYGTSLDIVIGHHSDIIRLIDGNGCGTVVRMQNIADYNPKFP